MQFHGTIVGGAITFRPSVAVALANWRKTHEGSRIVLMEDNPKRSHSQNAYYWAYLEIIAREHGDTASDLHEFFKRKLLPPRFLKVRGEELRIPGSTKELDKAGFSEYLDKIAVLTVVPLPNPEDAGYVSNYDPIKR